MMRKNIFFIVEQINYELVALSQMLKRFFPALIISILTFEIPILRFKLQGFDKCHKTFYKTLKNGHLNLTLGLQQLLNTLKNSFHMFSQYNYVGEIKP